MLPPISPFSLILTFFFLLFVYIYIHVTCSHDFSYLFELISLYSYNILTLSALKEIKEGNTKFNIYTWERIGGIRKDVCVWVFWERMCFLYRNQYSGMTPIFNKRGWEENRERVEMGSMMLMIIKKEKMENLIYIRVFTRHVRHLSTHKDVHSYNQIQKASTTLLIDRFTKILVGDFDRPYKGLSSSLFIIHYVY